MIEAVDKAHGVSKARAVCDECGADEVVTCDYERKANAWVPDKGQALRKLSGWAMVKGKLRCPRCERERKFHPKEEEPEVSENVQDLRSPTREQRRQIVALLEDVYDVETERYCGKDTDKTVAETIGGGCMPGWVAEIREQMFGPDGANDEIEALMADVADARLGLSRLFEAVDQLVRGLGHCQSKAEDLDQKFAELQKRISAVKSAVGPKAKSA